jgi:hypothetical protein
MLYMKACPRCSGDIKLDKDNYGVYAKCLQCGFNRDFITRRGGYGAAAPQQGEPALPMDLPFGDQRREAA